jgi:hypothetical protein
VTLATVAQVLPQLTKGDEPCVALHRLKSFKA